jgi:adenine-specific DNA-methyltransferase
VYTKNLITELPVVPVANKQKLELTWIGKDTRPKLEPRILLEDAAQRVTEHDIFDK